MLFDDLFEIDIPNIQRIHMNMDLTDQAYTFHLHNGVTEIVYIDSGSGIYMVNRAHFLVERGDLLIIEGGMIHSGASSSHDPMRTIVLVASDIKWKSGGYEQNVIMPKSYPLVKSGPFTEYIGATLREIWRVHSTSHDVGLCRVMAASALTALRRTCFDTEPYWTIKRNETAEAILSYIYTRYSERVSLESLSREFCMSAGHMSRLFHKEFGISPINYLIDVRFSKSKGMLINTDMPIAEIANAVGFGNPAHFTKLFMKRIGYSPGDYRMLHRARCDAAG